MAMACAQNEMNRRWRRPDRPCTKGYVERMNMTCKWTCEREHVDLRPGHLIPGLDG